MRTAVSRSAWTISASRARCASRTCVESWTRLPPAPRHGIRSARRTDTSVDVRLRSSASVASRSATATSTAAASFGHFSADDEPGTSGASSAAGRPYAAGDDAASRTAGDDAAVERGRRTGASDAARALIALSGAAVYGASVSADAPRCSVFAGVVVSPQSEGLDEVAKRTFDGVWPARTLARRPRQRSASEWLRRSSSSLGWYSMSQAREATHEWRRW